MGGEEEAWGKEEMAAIPVASEHHSLSHRDSVRELEEIQQILEAVSFRGCIPSTLEPRLTCCALVLMYPRKSKHRNPDQLVLRPQTDKKVQRERITSHEDQFAIPEEPLKVGFVSDTAPPAWFTPLLLLLPILLVPRSSPLGPLPWRHGTVRPR